MRFIPAGLSGLVVVGALSIGMSVATANRIELPDLGDPAESALSVAKEREIGAEIMHEIRKEQVTVDDLMVREYISSLGHRLVAQADSAVHDFTFFVINEGGINAFALPGGYIGVNAGLILATVDEGELAAVIAHEISHITQRHLARAFFHQKALQGPVIAGLLAAILLGGEAGRAAMAATSAGSVQSQINFTRKNEQEADRVGIGLLVRSGFNASSMALLFGKMQKQARLNGGAPPEFLSTHPVHASRIAEAQSRALQYPDTPRLNSIEYRIVRARLKILLSQNPTRLAKNITRRLAAGQTADEMMDRYALAFALLRSGQLKAATIESDRLLAKAPDIMAFQLLASKVDMGAGRDKQALARLNKLRIRYPGNHILTLEYAQLLINMGRANQARTMLEDYLIFRRGDPQVYKLLSHAYQASGDTSKSHVYMAERYQLLGDDSQAISHLEAALRNPITDYYWEARLQAKLKLLREKQDSKKQQQ